MRSVLDARLCKAAARLEDRRLETAKRAGPQRRDCSMENPTATTNTYHWGPRNGVRSYEPLIEWIKENEGCLSPSVAPKYFGIDQGWGIVALDDIEPETTGESYRVRIC